MSKQKLEAKLA